MPASTRHHRVLAAIVHCVGFLTTALPALTTADVAAAGQPHPAAATAEPTMPSAPPAVPTPTRVTSPAPAPKVSVTVAPVSTAQPGYRIEVRNAGNTPVDTTVRQELPQGVSATAISAGGREVRPGGSTTTEVTWRLKLPPQSTTKLDTTLTSGTGHKPVTAPACAFAVDGRQPYDCATATWTAPGAGAAPSAQTPMWRYQAPALLAGLAVLVLLAVVGFVTWRRRRPPVAAALASDGPGRIYPRPAAPRPATRRRTPPVWLIVPVAATVLVATIGTAAWTATRRVAAIDTDSQPTNGAWKGTGASGGVGVPLREDAFEFTVYRMTCDPGRGARQCQATVGVRNLTSEHHSWHGKLQRAYLANGNWVTTDEQATRRANQGRDVFAEPMAAGSRLVLPLVFTVNSSEAPQRLELRSGVFSAGVRVDVP